MIKVIACGRTERLSETGLRFDSKFTLLHLNYPPVRGISHRVRTEQRNSHAFIAQENTRRILNIMNTVRNRRAGLMVTAIAAVGAANALASIPAQAQVLFDFNYNGAGGTTSASPVFPISASTGTATLTTNFVSGTVIQNAGTSINALSAADAPATGNIDISFQNGTSGANSGKFALFSFSTLGYTQPLIFSTALRRSSTSGPSTAQLAFSTDGTTFQDITGGNLVALNSGAVGGYGTAQIAIPSNLNNVATAFLRITFTGGSATANTSNVRLDNTRVSVAASTPAPSALLPFALGVPLLAVKLRRRK